MSSFSTPAIILRRIEFGDDDLILSFITLNKGKISAIAKSAKKSAKRFVGILEPFSILKAVFSVGKGKGRLPLLQEAVLTCPFSVIRSNFIKTAYASYWAELIHEWMEEAHYQADVFLLFEYVLKELDSNKTPEAVLSVLFQLRFITLAGYGPNLTHCSLCKKNLEEIKKNKLVFDIKRGGLICDSCKSQTIGLLFLSKRTIKQLLWINSGNLEKAKKIRIDDISIKESLEFLETFVPYHLGKSLRSLSFLRKIRSGTTNKLRETTGTDQTKNNHDLPLQGEAHGV